MYIPDAPRNLISYKDLRANEIHVYIELNNNEEIMELKQGHRFIATIHVGDDNLY